MLLYKIINPIVKTLLRSPLHRLMSGNTTVLYFTGRNSGREFSTPVSYLRETDTVYCFTGKESPWWKNVAAMNSMKVLLQGQQYTVKPAVVLDDDNRKADVLSRFLRAVPRDAAFAGVKLNKEGEPDSEDIQRVVPDMVLLELTVAQ